MQGFKEFIAEDGIDYFVVEINTDLISKLALLNEGNWVETGKKNWMQRVDAENPALKQQRHVHVAKARHISNKNMQASWNQDKTKHDSKTFNSKIGSLDIVQSIAKQALELPQTAQLQEATIAGNLLLMLNESNDLAITPRLFIVKLA
jgi:hypothetical protein